MQINNRLLVVIANDTFVVNIMYNKKLKTNKTKYIIIRFNNQLKILKSFHRMNFPAQFVYIIDLCNYLCQCQNIPFRSFGPCKGYNSRLKPYKSQSL